MPKRTVDLRWRDRPLLDIASYGRHGPGERLALTSAEVAHASRTARGVPEVMIKVSGGARTIRGVASHLEYLEKRADLETDEGAVLTEKGLARELLKDWDLEVDERRRHTQRGIAAGRKPRKLVHNLVFSMPKGDAAGQAPQGGEEVRHREVRRSASICDGVTHGPGSSARPCCREGRERAGRAAEYLQGHAQGMAPGLRSIFARVRRGGECYRKGGARLAAPSSQDDDLSSGCSRGIELRAGAGRGSCAGAAQWKSAAWAGKVESPADAS